MSHAKALESSWFEAFFAGNAIFFGVPLFCIILVFSKSVRIFPF